MSTEWSQAALRATLPPATPASATDGRTNPEKNCVNGPTMLERKPMVLENGTKKIVRRGAQQFLTYRISPGHSASRGKLDRIHGNLYHAHFPARYRCSQFHCTHVIGATPMTRYTPMPANTSGGDD